MCVTSVVDLGPFLTAGCTSGATYIRRRGGRSDKSIGAALRPSFQLRLAPSLIVSVRPCSAHGKATAAAVVVAAAAATAAAVVVVVVECESAAGLVYGDATFCL